MRLGLFYGLALLASLLTGCGKENTDQAATVAAPQSIPAGQIATATSRTLQPSFALPADVEAIQSAD
ncbi:hypothetical protein, partial [Pseudomaricurvus sp.]|uniref:hypothetical protein n=1 Tax=Pseudomaricurvus sp. TaxID=2004510 RepID=UPI003F6C724A